MQPYYFYAQPYLAGAVSDTVTWTVNDTLVGRGDTLVRVLSNGASTICANLVTSSGCQSQYCQTIQVGDTTTPPPPPTDSTGVPVTPPDSAGQLIRCFPNPAYNATYVIIRLDKEEVIYVRVYNSMGSEVEQNTVSGFAGTNSVRVPLASLQQGIYYIQLQYGNEVKRSRIQKL